MPFSQTKFMEKVKIEVENITKNLSSQNLITLNESDDGISSTPEDYRKALMMAILNIIQHERDHSQKQTNILQKFRDEISKLAEYRKPGQPND